MRKNAIHELDENIHVMGTFDPKDFVAPTTAPVISIYIPIHRTEREDRRDEWDRIELKDLAREAERRLQEGYDAEVIKPYVEKLDYLITHEDLPLWLDASAGLGFLINKDDVYVFNLSFAPRSTVVVSDAYYIKPLLRNAQYDMTYKLLLLNTDFFALLNGTYNGVHYEPLPNDVKDYFAETFPEFDGETTALDYYSLEDHESPYHDHKSRKEVTQEEAEKFFRYVNKAMNDKLVRDDDAPVILVTAPEHDHAFRQICTFDLLPEGIKKDPRTLSGTELRDEAVALIEAQRAKGIDELIEQYSYHAAKGNATDDIDQIGLALVERKVAFLLLEEGKGFPGTFDAQTGKVTLTGTAPVDDDALDPAAPDLANAFADAAIAQDAKVIVLPALKMPTKKGIAAIYRY